VYEHFQSGIGKRGKSFATSVRAIRFLQDEISPRWPMKFPRMENASFRRLGQDLPSFPADAKGLATRDSSGKVENAIAKNVPWFFGAPRTSRRQPRRFHGVADFEAGNMPDEICTSASANMHGRGRKWHELDEGAPLRRDVFLFSPIT